MLFQECLCFAKNNYLAKLSNNFFFFLSMKKNRLCWLWHWFACRVECIIFSVELCCCTYLCLVSISHLNCTLGFHNNR